MSNLEYEAIFKKTKLLLGNYKSLCWKSSERAGAFYEELQLESKRLDVALEFLMEYSCEMNRDRFMCRISSFFKTKWLVEVIDIALGHVYDYHDNGKLHKEIISLAYLDFFNYNESDILELINIDRSVYYVRKKEAIALLGFAIWGIVIPKYLPKVACQVESDTPNLNNLDSLDSLLEAA
jgi:hypothetical protein